MGLADHSKICSHNMTRTAERSSSADGLLSTFIRLSSSSPFAAFYLLLLCLVSCFDMGFGYGIPCGGFITVTNMVPKAFWAPHVDNVTRCIWQLESNHRSTINLIVNFRAHSHMQSKTSCQTFQIRDGGRHMPIILSGNCSAVVVSQPVYSTHRWLYVMFSSVNHADRGVLYVTYRRDTNRLPLPMVNPTACAGYQFTCSKNRLCISFAYRCDDYDDCGCGVGCDEENCESKVFEFSMMMIVGICLGISLALPVIFAGLLLEKRHHWDNVPRTASYRDVSRKDLLSRAVISHKRKKDVQGPPIQASSVLMSNLSERFRGTAVWENPSGTMQESRKWHPGTGSAV